MDTKKLEMYTEKMDFLFTEILDLFRRDGIYAHFAFINVISKCRKDDNYSGILKGMGSTLIKQNYLMRLSDIKKDMDTLQKDMEKITKSIGDLDYKYYDDKLNNLDDWDDSDEDSCD